MKLLFSGSETKPLLASRVSTAGRKSVILCREVSSGSDILLTGIFVGSDRKAEIVSFLLVTGAPRRLAMASPTNGKCADHLDDEGTQTHEKARLTQHNQPNRLHLFPSAIAESTRSAQEFL